MSKNDIEGILEKKAIWKSKPSLRKIYGDYYKQIVLACNKGSILEIGGGTGQLRQYSQNTIITDIQPSKWIDVSLDAQSLPFTNGSIDNIVLLDVLHHIEYPQIFFTEAERVLRRGGRLVMIEPGITPISQIILKLTHPEPIDMTVSALKKGIPNPKKNPSDANQGIPTLLFFRQRGRKQFEENHPGFKIITTNYLSLFAYPLSGGFRRWSAIPSFIVPSVLKIESLLLPFIGRLMAFRIMVTLERLD